MARLNNLRLLSLLLAWSLALPLAGAELASEPRPRDRQVAVLVTTLLESQHLSNHPLDEEIAKRTLDQFLKRLDPQKLYFNQSDVDQFLKLAGQLKDRLSNHDLTIAYTIFHRFQQRVLEHSKTIDKLLSDKFNFNLDETIKWKNFYDLVPILKQEYRELFRRTMRTRAWMHPWKPRSPRRRGSRTR